MKRLLISIFAILMDVRVGAVLYASGNIYIVDGDAGGIMKRPVGPWECYQNRRHYSWTDWAPVSADALPARTGSLFTC